MTKAHIAFRVDSDGPRIRAYEFLRLGQMPRCWPSVNDALLEEFERQGIVDERRAEAAEALFRHARYFDLRCHRLKSDMITEAQRLARSSSSPEDPIAIDELRASIRAQSMSMRRLYRKLDRAGEHDLGLLPVDDSVAFTEVLQLQQLIEVAMGLRSELRRDAGFGSWVRLTEIVDALAVTKFMARLLEGSVTLKKVSCNVTLDEGDASSRREGDEWAQRLLHARNLVEGGVRIDALDRANEVLG